MNISLTKNFPFVYWLEILIKWKTKIYWWVRKLPPCRNLSFNNPVAYNPHDNHVLIESHHGYLQSVQFLYWKFWDINRSESCKMCHLSLTLYISEFVWSIEECYLECIGLFVLWWNSNEKQGLWTGWKKFNLGPGVDGENHLWAGPEYFGSPLWESAVLTPK